MKGVTMKGKSNPFKFKVIETRYNGYHFRSRLEARWAVFFDTLGIKYHYEPEGYDLEGTWYLPDFWLPDYASFVEIKPTPPNTGEALKASQLALCTGKQVYIFAGNIGLPVEDEDEPPCYTIYLKVPPTTFARTLDGQGQWAYKGIDVSPEILAVLKKLDDLNLVPSVFMDDLVLETKNFCLGSRGVAGYRSELQKTQEGLVELAPAIERYEEQLYAVADLEQGWTFEFRNEIELDDMMWLECDACHELTMGSMQITHYKCAVQQKGKSWCDTERLIAAYDAARSARF